MYIEERENGELHIAIVEPVKGEEYRQILKGRFFFDWKTEKKNSVFKLRKMIAGKCWGLFR